MAITDVCHTGKRFKRFPYGVVHLHTISEHMLFTVPLVYRLGLYGYSTCQEYHAVRQQRSSVTKVGLRHP